LKLSFRKARFSVGVEIGPNTKVSRDSRIGAYSYIGRNCVVGKTEIGRYVSIADNVSIGNGEHDVTRISTSSMFYVDPYKELTQGDCTIESDVWIGVDAIVRRNVHIGFGAVIGANSFVNRDIPAFAIAVGSPAKVLRYRFPEDKRKRILDSKWWQNDPQTASRIIRRLEDHEGETGLIPT